ncbi:hypothetical protein BCR42DRAFT_404799 [Absidia repens]|uniref:PH domain-containing protein n=1 Tax=Absidia repens TaxID=90262 RepID=A0A1X2IWP1_9FUNG|nr:hypothetical protein BCR42DRAFT_404799 [Absidia repens]
MVDPVCAYSQLYHVAFQNTMKKAMFFIDRQLQDWTSLTKYNLFDQHRRITGDPHHPYSTYSTSTTTTTLSPTSDSFTSSTHTNNDRQHDSVMCDDDIPGGTQTTSTLSAPSNVRFLPLCFSSSSSQSLLPTQYHTLLTSEPKKLLHQQPIPSLRKPHTTTKSRPLSMPILPVLQTQRPQTPPPLYCNITHSSSKTTQDDEDPYIRATRKWQNRRSCIILPREEEGREDLPPYHCSVYKMAIMNVKMERNSVGKKINRRPWRRVYIELWGTVLRIYPLGWFWSTIANEPIHTISLAGAEASRAVDYVKRPCVLRLTGHTGIQLLVQSSTVEEMMSWIEHIQAGINISLDLEERPMPKFLTLQPRRGVDTGILCARMAELERRREQRRRTQQEILA